MARKKPRKKARRKTGSDGDSRWTSKLPPAPGELRILQAFVNTADLRGGTDLAGPRALAEWLEHWGLAPPDLELTDGDLREAKELREAFRTLIRCRPGKAPQAAALIDRAGQASPTYPRVDAESRGRFESPAESLDAALGHLVAILVESQLRGTRERLKTCAHETCRAAFYDFSRNRSAVWCTVQCGNRKSALAYRWRNIDSVRKIDAVRSWVRGR